MRNKEDNKVIFKDLENIKYLKMVLSELCDTLNENHKKVLAFNPNLSYKITFYSTFWNRNYSTDNDEQTDEIFKELKNIITTNSPFYTENMVDDFYTKLKNALHYNDYRIRNGFYYKDSGSTYDEEEYVRQKVEENIKEIGRYSGFPYYINLGVPNKYELAKKYIYFKDSKFVINDDLVGEFEKSRTYTTQNKQQQKALDLLGTISESFKQIKELNPDFCISRILDIDGELMRDKELKKFIYNIK